MIARAEAPRDCPVGISAATSERLFATLNRRPREADCRFEGVGTERHVLEARWSKGGAPLPPVRVVPRACAPSSAPGRLTDAFAVEVPAQIAESCPSVQPLIDALVEQVSHETPAGQVGSLDDPLFRAARALFAAILVLTLLLAARGVRRWRAVDRNWLAIGSAGFVAALALRTALPFSLGNWYAEVLPAVGPPPWMRFGPGFFALQSLLRDVGLWNAQALVATQLLIGAAAIPLLLGALWELRADLAGAVATVVLFVFTPIHARLSATASEHVLASTLCLALLCAWLRAARTGDRLWFALALLLFPAVCATRIDMAVQASLVLLWPLARDRVEREGALSGRAFWSRVALFGAVAAVVLALAYRTVAEPSHHPLPELRGRILALRDSLQQFWLLATTAPGWISLPSVLLAALGAAVMAVRRPLLLLRIAATLVGSFVALGRSLIADELLGSRYFLFTIPVFLIASGQGFAALLSVVPRSFRRAAATAALVALALWSGVSARSAYAVHYTFQDEYSFARRALAALPADCRVYQVPLRDDAFPLDIDCCLDLRRSPLVLEFPQLRFRALPKPAAAVFAAPGCVAYYEGSACQITDDPTDPAVHHRADKSAAFFRSRCAEVRRTGRLELLAETTASPHATVNFFHGTPPRIRLYRWREG